MVNDDNEKKVKQQEHLRAFEAYFPFYSENHGILKEIKENLEELSKITDVEKQYEESGLILRKSIYNLGHAESHWENGKLWELITNDGQEATLDKYRRLIDKIRELHFEALEKINASKCNYCQKKNLTDPFFYLKGTEYEKVFCNQICLDECLASCDECKKSRYGANWQRTNQEDGKKFCSKECYYK